MPSALSTTANATYLDIWAEVGVTGDAGEHWRVMCWRRSCVPRIAGCCCETPRARSPCGRDGEGLPERPR